MQARGALAGNRLLPRALNEIARPGWFVYVALFSFMGLSALLGILAALSGVFALIVGVVVVLCAAVALNYRIGVWILCLAFPLAQISLMPRQLLGVTGLNPINLLLFTTLAAVALHYVWRKFQYRTVSAPEIPRQLVLLYVIPIALAAVYGSLSVDRIPEYYISTIKAVSFHNATGYLRDMFVRPMFLVVFALLVAFLVRESDNLKVAVLPAILGANIVAGLVFLIVALSGGNLGLLSSASSRSFLSGLGMHANEIGLLLNSALAITLFSMRAATGVLRLVHMATVATLVLAVLLTFSRGGYVGLLVVYAAFLLHSGNARSLVITAIAGVVVLLVLPSEVYERASHGLAGESRGAITSGRIDQIWIPLLPTLFDHPIFGSGLASILWSAPAQTGQIAVAHPHNAYLALLMDMGIVGFALVMSFFYWAWRTMRATARWSPDPYVKNFLYGASISIPLLFVQGLSDDRFTPTTPQAYLWFAIGATIGIRGRLRQANATSVAAKVTPHAAAIKLVAT